VALVACESDLRVGVDVEADEPGSIDISSKVIADDEMADLAPLGALERAREVLLRFSAKEAIYKALDPFVHRFVGFKEVSVAPQADGRADVRLHLDNNEGPFAVEVRWRRFDALVLTTARVARASK
jgi:4'-phosphopantetheinyl transferase EntD